jgi:hypothetical protein
VQGEKLKERREKDRPMTTPVTHYPNPLRALCSAMKDERIDGLKKLLGEANMTPQERDAAVNSSIVLLQLRAASIKLRAYRTVVDTLQGESEKNARTEIALAKQRFLILLKKNIDSEWAKVGEVKKILTEGQRSRYVLLMDELEIIFNAEIE